MNKEYGSDFHFIQSNAGMSEDSLIENTNDSLFFSGRVALYNLLDYGIRNYGWKRVGFPSYYCHEVVEFCETLPIELFYYPYNPFQPKSFEWDDDAQHVFINVDFFGLGMIPTGFLNKSIVIEDVSNNLLKLRDSRADYCFASLRKQLPVPVGGIGKDVLLDSSPKHNGHQFPEDVSSEKIAAMFLKAKYLDGEFNAKKVFRNLYIKSEKSFSSCKTNSYIPANAKQILLNLSHKDLIDKTRANINLAKSLFQPHPNFKLLTTEQNTEMGLMFIFENQEDRDSLKTYLIKKDIYPSILWPNQKTKTDKYFEERVLFVHADFRYTSNDIRFIVNRLNSFGV